MKDKERNMKDKVLESEIRKHAEALAVALRKYTDEPMYNATEAPAWVDYIPTIAIFIMYSH